MPMKYGTLVNKILSTDFDSDNSLMLCCMSSL